MDDHPYAIFVKEACTSVGINPGNYIHFGRSVKGVAYDLKELEGYDQVNVHLPFDCFRTSPFMVHNHLLFHYISPFMVQTHLLFHYIYTTNGTIPFIVTHHLLFCLIKTTIGKLPFIATTNGILPFIVALYNTIYFYSPFITSLKQNHN